MRAAKANGLDFPVGAAGSLLSRSMTISTHTASKLIGRTARAAAGKAALFVEDQAMATKRRRKCCFPNSRSRRKREILQLGVLALPHLPVRGRSVADRLQLTSGPPAARAASELSRTLFCRRKPRGLSSVLNWLECKSGRTSWPRASNEATAKPRNQRKKNPR